MNLSNFFTKKSVLVISLVGTAILFTPFSIDLYSYCFQQGRCPGLWNFFEIILPYLLLFPPILVISIIIYFLREEIFRTWSNFTAIWVLFVIIIALLFPAESQGKFFSVSRGEVVFVFDILYALISLLIILWKYFISLRVE